MGITRTGTGKVGESEEKKEDSIKDQIYNKIFAGIMNNEFSFDEFLTEKSLMEKYQVSRAPVREALMQLRSDRIIASTPRHGYRIRKPAQEELRDIINFRTVMECSFLERYHDMVTKDRIRELRTLCQEYENGGESRSFMEYWKLNREFHETLFMTYKNEVALHYLLESIDRQSIYFLETMKNCYMAADLHFALLDYLEQGDFRTASTLLRADIEKLPICESLVADKVECVGFSLC